MTAAPAWARVKLRVAWGDVPPCGATLKFATGRRYQVIKVAGKTLHCIVLPPGARGSRPVIAWQWAPRKKKARVFR